MTDRQYVVLALLLVASLVLHPGCSRDIAWSGVQRAIEAQYPGVRHVTTDSLAAWLEADSIALPLLLDARSPEEYAVSHLKGAVRFDPDPADTAALDSLPRDKPIVAYCSVGYRSSEVATKLQDAGFTNVMNLEGSIFRWANEGRPVYRGDEPVHEVHPYNAAWGRLLQESLHSE